jgi:hypothetical protein
MTKADKAGLILRDAAALVAQNLGVEYDNERIRIALDSADPNTLEIWERERKVFCVIWQSDGENL